MINTLQVWWQNNSDGGGCQDIPSASFIQCSLADREASRTGWGAEHSSPTAMAAMQQAASADSSSRKVCMIHRIAIVWVIDPMISQPSFRSSKHSGHVQFVAVFDGLSDA